jgi:ribosomal protein S12 methylthiotransferase
MKNADQKFSIVSLGCARNLVDSEVMAGLLKQNRYIMVEQPEEADIVLVNTCGFIDAAKAESIDTIIEIGRLKEEGKLKKLVVAGCLSQRYPDELANELTEVDLFIGTGEVPRIAEILREHDRDKTQRRYVGLPQYLYNDATPRVRTTPSYSAFVKVSEGCDHKCAFCIIPQLRGPHRSRPIESVVKEAAKLVECGVKEINLIAQDLTAYGRDREDGATLYELLSEMVKIPDMFWLRLLYAYPNFLDERLLNVIRESKQICKYIDIPFQHINRGILQRMRRGKSGSAVWETIQRLRDHIPGVTLRTSLIVGFPGETQAEFNELLDFVEQAEFDRLGVFKYSDQEGTAAATLPNKISEEEIERRWQEIMDVQATISRRKNEALIGTIQQVMIEGVDSDTKQFYGRTQAHAPEVDGLIYVQVPKENGRVSDCRPGAMLNVRITDAQDYDLVSEISYAEN